VCERGAEWTDDGGSWCVVVEGPAGRDVVDAFGVAHDCVESDPHFEARARAAAETAGLSVPDG